MLRITDKAFRYTPSHETDLRKRFRQMAKEKRAAAAQREAKKVWDGIESQQRPRTLDWEEERTA